MQGNRLTRLSHYINTGFPCDKKSLLRDLHKYWNDRETLSINLKMDTNMSTNHMITIQQLMSEHFSDSISNRSARPEENTAQKKYLTRLLDHNNIDLLCDKESSLTDLPESWPHKELLHNIYGLINHGNQIIPVTHKEAYLLSRPSRAMAQWRIHYMPKEVHLLSGPPELQPVTIALPHNDYGITQYTPREKAQDLPQLSDARCPQPLDASEAQKLKSQTQIQRQTRHNYSQLTENEKAKFQNPFTYSDDRNFVECNPVKKISDDLVYPTKSHTSSISDSIFSEEREEITEDIPAPAEDVPAPAPTLETVEEQQPYTLGSRKCKQLKTGFLVPALFRSRLHLLSERCALVWGMVVRGCACRDLC